MKRFLIAATAIVATGVAIEKMIDFAINYNEDHKDDVDLSEVEGEETTNCMKESVSEDDFDEFKPFKEFSDHEFKSDEFTYTEDDAEDEEETEAPDFIADVLDETNRVMKELGGKAKDFLKSIPSVEINVNVKPRNNNKEN